MAQLVNVEILILVLDICQMIGKEPYRTLGMLRATKIANKYVMSKLVKQMWVLGN